MTTNKLTTIEDNKKIAEIPDFLKDKVGGGNAQKGMEDVDSNDILLPRLGLCQSLSPQRRKGDKAFIPGLEEGMLFNTVTGEIYGATLEIIMLYFFKNRIKFNPIDDGGGIDCASPNGVDGGRITPQGCASCRFSTWGNGTTSDETGNDAPECTLYHNYMSFTFAGQQPSPLALSFKSSGIKISKQLLAQIRLTRVPMFAKKYKVDVIEMRDGQNMWYEKKIVPLGYVDKEVYGSMEQLFDQLKAANIHVDTTGEEGDASFDPDADEKVPY